VGGLLAQEMQLVGFVALVTDGLVRDIQELRQLSMPIWCRGTTTRASAKRNPGLIGESVVMGGAVVQQGDWVIADDDGVVIWPQAATEKLLTQAQIKLDSDNARLAKLQARAVAQH
jgi:regulator of RNase E activity RraA